MTVKDLRDVTFEGPAGLERMYGYAHSAFPVEKWSRDLGPFKIDGMGRKAPVHWRWIMKRRLEVWGTVSTGTDVWENRGGL